MERLEGQGWRLQLDSARQPYQALIGGEDWAVELSAAELGLLRRAVHSLGEQWSQLLPMLMAEEQCDLELDLELEATGPGTACGSLHVALAGCGADWSLRFVLSPADGSRAVEGGWGVSASRAFAAALECLALP